jgi:hypothetical protein
MQYRHCVTTLFMAALAAAAMPGHAQQPLRFTDRDAPGTNQARMHDQGSPHHADFLPASGGRRNFGGYAGGGNNGSVYAAGPGFSAWIGGFPVAPGWGWGGGWWNGWGPGCGPGWGFTNSVFISRPFIFSGNELFGPNLQQLWNPQGIGIAPPPPQVNIIQVVPRNADIIAEPLVEDPQLDDPIIDGPAIEAPFDGGARDKPARKPREANEQTLARAWRWIELGDRYFGKQEYRQAHQRYREAAKAAPGLVEAYLRQGQAMLATGQYTIAAPAFRRAFKLEADLRQARFRLGDLYGDNRVAKTAHLEALATAAEKDPANGDLLMMIGAQLLFDGQDARSRPFFEQAAALLAVADMQLAAVLNDLPDEPLVAGQPDDDVPLDDV